MYLSGVSISVHHLLWLISAPDAICGWRTQMTFHLTSSLVSSRPVWNWTPLPRFSLIWVRSLFCSQLSASIGRGCIFSS